MSERNGTLEFIVEAKRFASPHYERPSRRQICDDPSSNVDSDPRIHLAFPRLSRRNF